MSLYSSIILSEIGTLPKGVTPANASVVLVFCGFFGTLVAIPVMKMFSRRAVFQFGHICNFVLFMIAGIAFIYKQALISLICLILFEFTFCCSNGTVFWLYIAEITVDKGLGIAVFIRMITLFILSIVTLPILKSVGFEWFFFFFGGF